MSEPEVIIGCGILEKEIRFIIEKNGWQQRPAFLPSGLHVDFDKLRTTLEKCLTHYSGQKTLYSTVLVTR